MFLRNGKYLTSYCNPCRAAKRREWYLKNQEHAKQYAINWHKQNYDPVKKIKSKLASEWNKNNPERRAAIYKKHCQKFKHKYSAKTMMRNAQKRMATPKWLTKDHLKKIESIYLLRDLYSLFVGKKHEVDHIVPLKSGSVCGLHVPWNLRIITQFENRSKSNKFTELTNG
jgi:hypothetical protein